MRPLLTDEQLQELLNQAHDGDKDAGERFFEALYARIAAAVKSIIRSSYPDLPGHHDLDSVINNAWLHIPDALRLGRFRTAAEFVRMGVFIACKYVLPTMIKKQKQIDHRELQAKDEDLPFLEAATTTHDPNKLVEWTEFHRQVSKLPENERRVFDLRYYEGLSGVEAARMLSLTEKDVSLLWIAARRRLAKALGLG